MKISSKLKAFNNQLVFILSLFILPLGVPVSPAFADASPLEQQIQENIPTVSLSDVEASSAEPQTLLPTTIDFLGDGFDLVPSEVFTHSEEGISLEQLEGASLDTTTTTTPPPYVTGAKWPQPNGVGSTITVSYSVDSSLLNGDPITNAPTLEEEQTGILSTIASGFQTWASYIPIIFKQVASAAQIVISALSSSDFLAKFGSAYLAYGYYPTNGDIYFNLGYSWALPGFVGSGYKMVSTLIHEMGHSLGLAHSTDSTSVMYANYTGSTTLNSTDIQAIQYVYGAGIGSVITLDSSSNTAPVINAIPDKTAEAGKETKFTVSATDAENNPLTYTASNLPPGATFDPTTHVFSWIPDASLVGNSYTTTFTVSDGIQQVQDTVLFTVVNPVIYDPPTFNPIPTSYTVVIGGTITFDVLTTDPNGDSIKLTASLPKGATFVDHGDGTGTFTWKPTSKQGPQGKQQTSKSYSITFTATDSTGQVSSISTQIKVVKSTTSALDASNTEESIESFFPYEFALEHSFIPSGFDVATNLASKAVGGGMKIKSVDKKKK